MTDLRRQLIAEFLGTAFLLAAVVGSGIMAGRLTDDAGLALLIGAIVTGAVLAVMIAVFIEISGAHFNPVVTLAAWRLGGFPPAHVAPYMLTQLGGGIVGVVIANLMFELPAVAWSTTDRSGTGTGLGEMVATLGLVMLIFVLVRRAWIRAIPTAVGGFIAGAYFFTSSTAFANPAVTLARSLSDSPAGIAVDSVPAFIGAQLFGAFLAVIVVDAVAPAEDRVVVDSR